MRLLGIVRIWIVLKNDREIGAYSTLLRKAPIKVITESIAVQTENVRFEPEVVMATADHTHSRARFLAEHI